jgi:hypothetical protein
LEVSSILSRRQAEYGTGGQQTFGQEASRKLDRSQQYIVQEASRIVDRGAAV